MKSKEQTPIEELIEQIRLYKPVHIKLDEDYLSSMIQKEKDFIQAKVLEALESEVPKALSRGAYLAITKIDVVNTGIEPYIEDYIETEVKPKYETS